MRYTCRFYRPEDLEAIEQLVLASYAWSHPVWGLSRQEFCLGLHPNHTGFRNAWLHTVGIFLEDAQVVGCVINEGNYDGEVFFLFDSQARAQDTELLAAMIRFAKTQGAAVAENRRTRFVNIAVPEWNTVLTDMLLQGGFQREAHKDTHLILPFDRPKFEVSLPQGYGIVDGATTPAFFLSNVHRQSFAYGRESHACDHGAEAFAELRTMKHYRKDLDLCVLDPTGMPVAFCMIWYDPKMPYCELEPLAVSWWERRKGLGTAILHEAANRVMALYPTCTGMLGGDQAFYSRIGYECRCETPRYHWEIDVVISWEKDSFDRNYAREAFLAE